MKNGDKLICKKDFTNVNGLEFKKHESYTILNIDEYIVGIISIVSGKDFVGFVYKEEMHKDIIYVIGNMHMLWDYFYTESEIRKRKLQSII